MIDPKKFKEAKSKKKKALLVVIFGTRLFGFLTGVGTLILGAVTLKNSVSLSTHMTNRFLVGLVSFFCIIFGILLIIAETRNKYSRPAMNYFLFLKTYIGRGIFCVMIGVLCLALPLGVNGIPWGDVVGACMCAAGALNLALFPVVCMTGKDEKQPNHQRFEDEADGPPPPEANSELPSPIANSVSMPSGSSASGFQQPSNPFDDKV